MNMKEKSNSNLSLEELKLLPKSYDVVGDIAIIKVQEKNEYKIKKIAKAVLHANKHVKTVLCQVSPISGNLRLRKLKYIDGEEKTVTLHREASCVFHVDLERCYFSPRLSYERMRVAKQVAPSEVIVNMFAGIGCFSIIIAKYAKARKIYSIDINPHAIRYMRENVRLNRVENIVQPVEGDAREVIEGRLQSIADRILMPLPEKAYEYLDSAVMALKQGGGFIHYYDFEHARKDEKPIEKVWKKVTERLMDLNVNFDLSYSKIVRPVGPRWFQIVLDVFVHKKC